MKQVLAFVSLSILALSFASANANGRRGNHWQGQGGQWHGQGPRHGGNQYNWDNHYHRRYYPQRPPAYPVYPRPPIYPAPIPLPPPIEQQIIIGEPYPQQGCQQDIPCQQEIPCYEQSYECQPPIVQTIPEQSYYCPSAFCQQAPPVLPYPGLNVHPVPLPGNFGIQAFCQIRQTGRGIAEIIQNNQFLLYRGSIPNVHAMLNYYRRTNVCR